ncbi:hypothetical protein JIN85_19210 [Luteolibacter pohnpeiensis]|uniref:Uncharacterized protein n=1 Tax=Luteolibacter pohnpeiensis TaxID=454153 RepID=A0A934SG43_9BACT|nr:hypothetical protein [Luteolibacter pohnpeiensis]MBK1884553.1 hypothetical protein [Luteolibacter pohnpeiensis]
MSVQFTNKARTLGILMALIAIFALIALTHFPQQSRPSNKPWIKYRTASNRQNQLPTELSHRLDARLEQARILETEEKTALNLSKKIVTEAFIPPRFLYVGEEHIPSTLVDEAAHLKGSQLRVLIRELRKNPDISGTDRALLISLTLEAWLSANKHNPKQSLWQALDIIQETLQDLPPGYDILPVSSAMGPSLEWDLPLWVDFIEDNWGRWDKTSNGEVLRRDLLSKLKDPQLRIRVVNLSSGDSSTN